MRISLHLLHILVAVMLLVLLPAGPVLAAGSGGDSASDGPSDPDWAAAEKAVDDEDFAGALPLLRTVVAKDDRNADAYNYLGYTLSHLDKYEGSKQAYDKALALKPEHRGANEYLGELYLKMGNLAGAEERLKVLDSACFFGCEEFEDLKQAIAEFKRTGKYGGSKH